MSPSYEDPGTFKDLLGGAQSLVDYDAKRKGIFAVHPAATPKYGGHEDPAESAYYESMARLFIPFPDQKTLNQYLRRLRRGGTDSDALNFAKKLLAVNTAGEETNRSRGYIDFLLQRATETFREKHQVVELLSDNYASFFFGASAPVFSYDAIVYNTLQDNWRAAFNLIYHHLIRGTQLARNKALVTLAYDDVAVTGTMVDMAQVLEATTESYAQIRFSILVKRYDFNRVSGKPLLAKGAIPDFIQPSMFSGLNLQTSKSTLRDITGPVNKTTTRVETDPAKDDKYDITPDATATPSERQRDDVRGLEPEYKKGMSLDEILVGSSPVSIMIGVATGLGE